MLTRSLAKDLGPHVRVNGVSPGAILWPDEGMSDRVARGDHQADGAETQRRAGGHRARRCYSSCATRPYVTGQIIAVDGGRSVGW